MTNALVPVTIASCYQAAGRPVMLPAHLAWATPDTATALSRLAADVAAAGGVLRLSDLFRSYDAQKAAHEDWAAGRKRAFSPPPGESLHEAGRACDIDLGAIAMPLARFWTIAAAHGFTPIVASPDSRLAEAWHFERHGSHALVHAYYARRSGTDMSPAAATAASAILAAGIRVDRFDGRQSEAAIQSALIRLGQDIGNMDGRIGPRTRAGLAKLGLSIASGEDQLRTLGALLDARFPEEADQAGGVVPIAVSSR